MKKAAFAIIALLLLVANVCFAGEYVDSDYGYSVTIPNEWMWRDTTGDVEGVSQERCRAAYANKEESKFRTMTVEVSNVIRKTDTVPSLYSVPDYDTYTFLKDFSEDVRSRWFDVVKAKHRGLQWLSPQRVKLPNNIWVICHMRDETTAPAPVNFVFAGTVFNNRWLVFTYNYMGDEHSAETVFRQILESVKPI